MVDALGVQHIQGAPNIGRWAFFTRVGHQLQTQLCCTLEDPLKLLGRMAAFAGVQSNTNESIPERSGLLQSIKSLFFGQMPQKTQNQGRADAQLGLSVHTGALQTGDDGAHGHFTLGVGLRIEKDFRMNHVVGFGSQKVSPSHIVKILRLLQHAGTRIVNIQKALQIGEGISCTKRFHAGVAQTHTVTLGQSKNQLRLQRPLDVHMQLGFGHGA